ncbi:putative E3 ubiquitin-protein ligase LUL4 [Iris pallida]|uniref:RING-type E3 ubiquitin transferase n=1 Tax=Iris pallida TaxID=29817 RepID=A0AAX6HU12_IRIPA|nr:putative E3 ubiquitin-protein ligase LUL4 [Iris pallida]
MGQSPSNRRKCYGYGYGYHHHHHPHQYQYQYSFPPPPLPPPYPLYGNPVRVFSTSTEAYSSNAIETPGPSWASPPSFSSHPSAGDDQDSPPEVEHQKARRIRNVVNVHRDSVRVEPDEQSAGHSLVSFTFDAVVDGSFTIFYFAKEGANCSFSLMYPEIYMPLTVPFQKGVGQKFLQPSGSGINLGFFGSDELSTPLHGDVYPLVVYAGASSSLLPRDELVGQSTIRGCAQITEAIIKSSSDGPFEVKVIKQILWLDGNRYELQEIFDLGLSVEADFDEVDGNPEKECVICMSEPTDTAVLPCRHMVRFKQPCHYLLLLCFLVGIW